MPALVLVLALLCVLAAAGGGWLPVAAAEPQLRGRVDLRATRSGIEAVYAYDYQDSEGSVQGKLDVLTGDLRDQYEKDLTQGGIIDTYEQVSATTRYEVLDVGLQQVNEAQDTATLVVFGQYVVESVNSGTQPAPEGSECQVTPAGRAVLHPDGPGHGGGRGRRLEDQRAHPADHQLSSPVPRLAPGCEAKGTANRAAWQSRRRLPGWHHGRRTPLHPCSSVARPRDVAPVAPAPPTWTGRSGRGRVSCCAAL